MAGIHVPRIGNVTAAGGSVLSVCGNPNPDRITGMCCASSAR